MDKTNHTALCCVDGCGRIANRKSAKMCEMHYTRVRRNGNVEKKSCAKPGPLTHANGYLLDYLPGHPLQRGDSPRVYQHRAVYYSAHGDGPFQCNWCGKVVTWDDMHVDHLNAVVTDNRIENLVSSCASCNQKRGTGKMVAKMRSKGKQYTANGKTMCLSEWARDLGISRESIVYRINAGWEIDKVFSGRVGKTGPKSKAE